MSVKGNSDNQPKNYYGDSAGLVCFGQVDELVALIIDGHTAWPTDKGWADDITELVPISYQRKSNVASVEFATPHRIGKGKKFILTGMADASFNEASPAIATDASATVIRYANVGANVAKTATSVGKLTKVVHYNTNDLVRYAGGIWKSLSAHDSDLTNAPPNPTYWQAYSVKRVSESNPYQFTVADSTAAYGTAYFYWGTDTQTLRAGSFLANHPPYRRLAFIELEKFLFGPERDGSPNIQVLTKRAAQQGIITGASAELSDGQANPIACCAELLTGTVIGIGQDDSLIDTSSWQAVADSIPTSAWISPFLDTRIPFREFLAKILAYYDGWFRFNASGVIEAGKFAHNEAPPSFDDSTTIDFNDILEDIAYDAETWEDTFSETVCKFKDRARAFQNASRKWNSGLNREVVGESHRQTVDRPWIIREAQALSYASEWGKIYAQRKISGTMKLRPEKVVNIKAGSLFKLTHDATALTIICRCTETVLDTPGSDQEGVQITYESERGFAPLPFSPTLPNPTGNQLAKPETIEPYVFVQPPPALLDFKADFALTILAARKHTLTRGFRPYLLVDGSPGDFYQLGEQRAWCAFGRLTQNYADNLPAAGTFPLDDDTETFQMDFDDFQAPEDIDAISVTQFADAINDDALLAWVFDDSDTTRFEICTVKSIRLDSGVYKLKVRRARFGTKEQAFVTGDRVFIGFRKDLQFYTHSKFNDYSIGATTATFRLQGFTAVEFADLTDTDECPDITFTFADPYAPTAVWVLEQANGVDIASFSTVYTPTDVFKFGFNMASPSGSLTDANLIIKLGSLEINVFSQNFDGQSIAYGEAEFKFPSDGTWTACLILRDASGRVSRTFLYPVGGGSFSTVIIETGGGGGSGTVLAPYALPSRNPHNSIYDTSPFNVSMFCATAGATIYYQIERLNIGDTPVEPSQTLPGAWINYTGPFSLTTHIHTITRIWMFATHAGLTNSPTTYQNY